MKERVGAIIVREGKLLLVTGYDLAYWWTPGGGKEEGETDQQALERELREELGVAVSLGERYHSFIAPPDASRGELQSTYYLAQLARDGIPQAEVTHAGWFSREELEDGTVSLFPIFAREVLPRLVADNLI